MRDPRIQKLARQLVHHSCRVQPHENVMIGVEGCGLELARHIVHEVHETGAYPFVQIHDPETQRLLLMQTSPRHMELLKHKQLQWMERMDSYIDIRGTRNIYELQDVPASHTEMYAKNFQRPLFLELVSRKVKWVILRYPNEAMAQAANMSTEGFEQFYFSVCTANYTKMEQASQALKRRMEQTDRVRIIGPDTDLSFSIKDMPVVSCFGRFNIPDGEIYTAPVIDSVQGVVTFNVPSMFHGILFENIRLEFEQGQIVSATSTQTEGLNRILNTDEGARYIGEFALGLNPHILSPMNDALFDEKIAGSFHLTPGQALHNADNGNRSSIHWDLVSIQRPEYGGGVIYFDDVCIRRDGLFVVEDLLPCNPDSLT